MEGYSFLDSRGGLAGTVPGGEGEVRWTRRFSRAHGRRCEREPPRQPGSPPGATFPVPRAAGVERPAHRPPVGRSSRPGSRRCSKMPLRQGGPVVVTRKEACGVAGVSAMNKEERGGGSLSRRRERKHQASQEGHPSTEVYPGVLMHWKGHKKLSPIRCRFQHRLCLAPAPISDG